MPVDPLPPAQLRATCSQEQFTFETTAELPVTHTIIGQPRGTRAIEFGMSVQSEGYNIYISGPAGSGRATAIERFLQERTAGKPAPDDWVYVHNFSVPHQPRAIELPAGEGKVFKSRMEELINTLKVDLREAFDSETYQETIEEMGQALEARQDALLQTLHEKAAAQNFALVKTAAGFTLAPVRHGKQLTAVELQQLPLDEQREIEAQQKGLNTELETVLYDLRQLENEVRQEMKQIDRQVAKAAIVHHFEQLRTWYKGQAEVLLYLDEVHQDVLNQIGDFAPSLESGEAIDLRRYEVNLFVDNSETKGTPIVIEQNPTYNHLIGRIEYEMHSGVVTTHFTNLKRGSLHAANGGYLIMEARDLFHKRSAAWEALKRALKTQKIVLQPRATMDGERVLAKSLDPEPVPLQVKIILMGSPALYYSLYDRDEDFRTLFKVRADFDSEMPCDAQHIHDYAVFIATRCHEEKERHFDRSAVTKVVEFGARLAGDQKKLSTLFGDVADLVREASHWAGYNGRDVVTAVDVRQALAERIYRANREEEKIQEQILDKALFIATEGSIVGQVNGLAVVDTGDYSFGQPGRITARTFMGEEGVIHIDRETDMSGPIHEKGVLTLVGYLGGTYAQRQPLSLSASLTFEQNYVAIDGDSASSSELYAMLSSLSKIPIKQGIGVTGSVNQRGEIQPVGGVNEKIEGFFKICAARGLTGEQGAIIPASNVKHLMLHEDVVEAVAAGKFHVWPISTIDEGIELLTDVAPGTRDEKGNYAAGTIHYAVQKRLFELAKELDEFGSNDDDKD